MQLTEIWLIEMRVNSLKWYILLRVRSVAIFAWTVYYVYEKSRKWIGIARGSQSGVGCQGWGANVTGRERAQVGDLGQSRSSGPCCKSMILWSNPRPPFHTGLVPLVLWTCVRPYIGFEYCIAYMYNNENSRNIYLLTFKAQAKNLMCKTLVLCSICFKCSISTYHLRAKW